MKTSKKSNLIRELNQNYSQYIMNFFPSDIAGYILGNDNAYTISSNIETINLLIPGFEQW